jgi:hypothetical protein
MAAGATGGIALRKSFQAGLQRRRLSKQAQALLAVLRKANLAAQVARLEAEVELFRTKATSEQEFADQLKAIRELYRATYSQAPADQQGAAADRQGPESNRPR